MKTMGRNNGKKQWESCKKRWHKKTHHAMTPTSAPTVMLRLLNAAPFRRIKGHFRHFVGSNLLGEGNADNDGVNASP